MKESMMNKGINSIKPYQKCGDKHQKEEKEVKSHNYKELQLLGKLKTKKALKGMRYPPRPNRLYTR